METLKKAPWSGTALTAAYLAFLLWGPKYFSATFSPAFLTVVLSVYIGGLYWGLASAGLVITAEVFLFLPEQYGRFVVVGLTMLGVVWLVSALETKARFIDSLNGNLVTLRETVTLANDLLEDWDKLPRSDLKNKYISIHKNIINLTTRAQGWHQLYLEMTRVKEE